MQKIRNFPNSWNFLVVEVSHLEGKLMQIWKSSNIFVFIKICWRFHIKTSFTFWDILPRDLWKVCLQIFRNKRICKKLAYFLRSLQASLANNSRIHRINNAHFSRYCFYMNTNIWGTFQIYISVPLKVYDMLAPWAISWEMQLSQFSSAQVSF